MAEIKWKPEDLEAVGMLATYIRLRITDVNMQTPHAIAALRLLIRVAEIVGNMDEPTRAQMYLRACLNEDPVELKQELEFIMMEMEQGR